MKTIGIAIDRQRTYGRRLCQGIVGYARAHTDWTLRIVEFDELERASRVADCDGFIARVLNDRLADRLAATGKPVVDVFCERTHEGFASVDQNARLIGQLAARHFIEHLFSHFAFCGYNGLSYSDMRRDAFVHCLALNHFDCKVYRTPASVIRELGSKRSRDESLHRPSDGRRLQSWISSLAKPVAVFCANDMRAYQTIQACHALGIRVPEEVAVLGVDDELVCEFLSPTLSSIDPNGRGVGFKAAETLDTMLANPSRTPDPAKVEPLHLVARGSTNTFPVNPPWLSSALVFIRGNIAKKLTASDVYRHLGKSHTLVDTAFRNVLHSSVQKEINRQRLSEAKRLISSTDLPIGQIAKLAGFASPQYFCAAFGKAFGQSPSAMRESSKPSDVSGEGRRARGPSKCA